MVYTVINDIIIMLIVSLWLVGDVLVAGLGVVKS